MANLVGEWGELTLALCLFLLTHAVPARPALRQRLVAMFGRAPYLAAYSVVSVALLVWVIRAAARAPYVELWPYDDRLGLVPQIAMVAACLLLVFGLTSPNPLSLGRRAGFDPVRPGVAAIVRHPVLWAALLWALSHVAPNGDLAHLIVFGLFAALALAGMLLLDRRGRRRLGPAAWSALAARTSNLPFFGYTRGARPRPTRGTLGRIAGAALLYAALVLSHGIIAGVPVPF